MIDLVRFDVRKRKNAIQVGLLRRGQPVVVLTEVLTPGRHAELFDEPGGVRQRVPVRGGSDNS
jgi:hypothetical protein